MGKKPNFEMINKIANFFGGIGYLACVIQWLWAILLFIEPIKKLAEFLIPTVDEKIIEKPIVSQEYNPSIAVISIIITILVICLSLFLMYKIPTTIAKNSKKIVHETTDKVVPFVIKKSHLKESKKVIIKLTAKIIFIIKIALITLPILIVFSSGLLNDQIFNMTISMTIGIFLASLSAFWFGIEYLIAKIFHIRFDEVW